jgi:hypothetical protein
MRPARTVALQRRQLRARGAAQRGADLRTPLRRDAASLHQRSHGRSTPSGRRAGEWQLPRGKTAFSLIA